jgi:uncharacterized protein YcfL
MNKLFILGAILFIAIIFVAPIVTNAQYYTGLCTYHASQRCIGNTLYWYDSCGNQQEVAQYNACNEYNNYNNYNNYGSCTYHAYKECVGNNVYWYNSCGVQQDLYSNCYNQHCQYGQCVNQIIINPPVLPNYIPYATTACYNNSVYWYDNLGVISGLNKNCNDQNSCTVDSCSVSKCINTLKCDGSTCAQGSTDYTSFCTTNPPVNTTPSFSVSFLVKQDKNSTQWQRTAQAYTDSQVYFMISVFNNSDNQVANAKVSANIPAEIASLGDLKLDNVSLSGDIVNGIEIGSIGPKTSKILTFEGRTQTISENSTKQAIVTINIADISQTDTLSINFIPTQSDNNAAAISSVGEPSGFMEFLKKWYMWIIAAIIIVFMFIGIYKRFSSEV